MFEVSPGRAESIGRGLSEAGRPLPSLLSFHIWTATVTFSSVTQPLPWRAWCLFSKTNISSRLQPAGLGDLAPTRKKQTWYNLWGCKIPPACRHRVQAVGACYGKCGEGLGDGADGEQLGGPAGASGRPTALHLQDGGAQCVHVH